MFVVMDFHRSRVDVRFERVFRSKVNFGNSYAIMSNC